jgi:hypothetical protein
MSCTDLTGGATGSLQRNFTITLHLECYSFPRLLRVAQEFGARHDDDLRNA